jgi:hypothetical protein
MRENGYVLWKPRTSREERDGILRALQIAFGTGRTQTFAYGSLPAINILLIGYWIVSGKSWVE